MKRNITNLGLAALLPGLVMSLIGCRESLMDTDGIGIGKKELRVDATIDQLCLTRVNDNGFADGDCMGVFIVDFNADGGPGILQTTGNRADNVGFTYQYDDNKWKGDQAIYWEDNRTPIDAYGYYPYTKTITDVASYPFAVATDQSVAADEENMGAYEASDFLWAKAAGVNPGEVIRLDYQHLMAGIQVTLVAGEDFEAGEWNELEKSVMIKNTCIQASIDLSAGTVTPAGTGAKNITPAISGTDYRAVLIPQSVDAGKELFAITVDGQSYHFVREQGMTYYSGKLHKFTIRVDNAAPKGDYRFTLIGEAVTAWENDLVSHEAEARSYVTVHVPEAGQLQECIAATQKDFKTIRNLKLTGFINPTDFDFMRDKMDCLEAVNLKEVKLKEAGTFIGDIYYNEDVLPGMAFNGKYTLTHIVFPDNLKAIAYSAFQGTQLIGDLNIPEGVISIEGNAFKGVSALTGSLSLPSTLKYIGNSCFEYCGFSSELHLPESLIKIGSNAFYGCSEITGRLHLPENLEEIGSEAFSKMDKIRGDIIIPKKITNVDYMTFFNSGFDGGVYFPECLNRIGAYAFGNTHIGGELILPEGLELLERYSFANTNITHVIFPQSLKIIEGECFRDCTSLQDTIKIPSGVRAINMWTFRDCDKVEAVILPENLQLIGEEAFYGCFSLNQIQCLGEIPPAMTDVERTFGGVAKDNFSVVVPANSVSTYRNTEGWNEFKRITAYRDFVCRPYTACALNAGLKKELVLNADGAWKVEHIPDWCHLSQTSGNLKTALTLTIDKLAHGQGNRQDKIVFSMENGEYTTYCTVSQCDYLYEENETLTLQTASQGRGIDLFWVGEGFDARDIAEGTYLNKIKQQVEYFFGLEPYKTYRDYFNVHTTIAMSQESGIGTLNTLRNVRFGSTLADCKTRMLLYPEQVADYMEQYSGASADILGRSLVTVCMNTSLREGLTYMYPEGAAIAYCPHSEQPYPNDARGIVQHEAGGHGFGKLGDEYIYHTAFIQTCKCTCCEHVAELQAGHSKGWFRNLSLDGTYAKNEWRHLIFDDRYSDIVDIFEGGYFHSRGVYRSEENSCMNNGVPYYSTISRQIMVERIMEQAGETFSFEKFAARDSRQTGSTFTGTTRSSEIKHGGYCHHGPVLMKKNPYLKR